MRQSSCSLAEGWSEENRNSSSSSENELRHFCWETTQCICKYRQQAMSGTLTHMISEERARWYPKSNVSYFLLARNERNIWHGIRKVVQVSVWASYLFPMTSRSRCRALSAASCDKNWTKASPEFLPKWSLTMVIPFSTMSKPGRHRNRFWIWRIWMFLMNWNINCSFTGWENSPSTLSLIN